MFRKAGAQVRPIGTVHLSSKEALTGLEERLTKPDFQFAQMIIQNMQWPRSTASVTLLKRLVGGTNAASRIAAVQALNNLQTSASGNQDFPLPAPIGYFARRDLMRAMVSASARYVTNTPVSS